MKQLFTIVCFLAGALSIYHYSGGEPLPVDLNILPSAGLATPVQKGWEPLFDGKDMRQWRQTGNDSMPGAGWVIKNGTLSVLPGRKGGDIITRKKYSDFELVFDFKLTVGANSGIKYRVNPIENSQTKKTSMMGIEYQIIDDTNYPEIKDDPNGLSSAGSAYLLYAPVGKKLLPAGEWNHGRIVVKGKYAEHWLNGVKVASYTKGTADFNERLGKTKFKDYPDYAKADNGYIMLTDHGDQVYFKDIKIKAL
ncbi:MAG TPA: DUF1080 domain-containing protein [Agriterribacter sp.]|nr:DUF1080 domain-containing protein [Agriterribacter sp.]